MNNHACPLCRASAGEGLVCAGCVANTLYYKQQSVAYKKVALRDLQEQTKAVLSARRSIFEQEQALATLLREQGLLKEELHQVSVCVCMCVCMIGWALLSEYMCQQSHIHTHINTHTYIHTRTHRQRNMSAASAPQWPVRSLC